MFTGQLALTFAALFAGAAFYINFAEQPARLRLDPNQLLMQWAPSYKKGFVMQATLAVLSGIASIATYFLTHDWRWIVGGVFMLANWPFTLFVIMPTNRKLMAIGEGNADAQTVVRIIYWGKLHAVRTGLGLTAVAIFLWTLCR